MNEKAQQPRRIKRLPFAPQAFHVKSGDVYAVTQGVPEGSSYVGCTYDQFSDVIYFWYENPAWPEVELHELPEEIKIIITKLESRDDYQVGEHSAGHNL